VVAANNPHQSPAGVISKNFRKTIQEFSFLPVKRATTIVNKESSLQGPYAASELVLTSLLMLSKLGFDLVHLPTSKALGMIPLNVTDEQFQALRYERCHYPHPRVQKKMEVVFLRASGLSVAEVCRLADVLPNTYPAYLRDFQQTGIDGLKRFACAGTVSDLDAHADTIIESMVEQPVRTLAHASKRFIELTGIERSNEHVRQFLRRKDFKLLKVGSMPAKAGTAEALAASALPDLISFRSSIESTLSELNTTHRGEMKILVTRNFQLFDNAHVLA
jgi:transposase